MYFAYNKLSRGFGKFCDLKLHKSIRPFTHKLFASTLKINADEAELPLDAYESFNAFFTRALKPGLRQIASSELVSPVDGTCLEWSDEINYGKLIQAKGLFYSLDRLLPEDAQLFLKGSYLTIYLAPSDCHRIFSPLNGEIYKTIHVPGLLYPVREPHISKTPNLYTRNERVISFIDTEHGKAVLVMVGATNVGNISATFDSSLKTNVKEAKLTVQNYSDPISVNKGDWIHTFHLGSTVILVLDEKLKKHLGPWKIPTAKSIRFGEQLVS